LLLHAFPLDERMWEPQIGALEGADAVAPRLYGRGPSLDRWAAEILNEVDGPLIVVGASMGGYVGLAMAARAPERVRGLLLVGARAGADSAERRRDRDVLITLLGDGDVPPGMDTTASAAELAAAAAAMRDRPDRTGVVRAFAGPLVVAVGDADDVLSVGEARELAALARQGRLEVFPGAGHLVPVEQPEEFNRALLEFVASV
jgi:pimeloyl-ACP methyl ester carboxylesterase